MSNELMLYLMTRADSAQALFGVAGGFAILSAGAAGLFYIITKVEEEHDFPSAPTAAKRLFFGGVLSIIISVIIPTKSDLIFIYGGSTILEAVKSQRATNLGNKTLDAVEKWLEEAAGEKKP